MLIKTDDIINIVKQFNINITGVLHVGAHDCEEMSFYNEVGVHENDILWIDALESKVAQNKMRGIPNVYHAVVTNEDDSEVVFNVANNGQSSSVLDFGMLHQNSYPNITYVDKIVSKTITLNTFFHRNNIDSRKYNFWNFDIQGAELLALKGAINHIGNAKIMYLEVNEKEVYKNCGLITEIDQLLSAYGFVRAITQMTTEGWGDALYVKI